MIRYSRHIALLSFLLIFLMSCNGVLSREEYKVWVTDEANGLKKVTEQGNYTYELQYRPLDYIALLQYDNRIDSATYDQLAEDMGGLEYYQLKIAPKDGSDLIQFNAMSQEEIQGRVYYFSYDLQKGIYLEQDGKQLPCELFHFERSFDTRSHRIFLLGFERISKQQSSARVVVESDLLGANPIYFDFDKIEIPKVALINDEEKK